MEYTPLVTASWLNQHLDLANLRILFTRMSDPVSSTLDAAPTGYIPGSQLFDFEREFCDLAAPFPHTLPSPEQFELQSRKLGINRDSIIVIYDQKGAIYSPRVWWMLRYMGHKNVYVLDGGLPGWQDAGYRSEPRLKTVEEAGDFIAHPQRDMRVETREVLQSLHQPVTRILDARAAGRFDGTAAEPRPGLKSGHIPGSANIPFNQCFDQQGRFHTPQQLESLFDEMGIDACDRLIFTCGSGVTACILALAAELAGYHHYAVYDGSWSEWGAGNLPVEVNNRA